MEIKGKNALITGSAAGIGQATAFALADAGAAGIALADLDEKGLLDTANVIEQKGSRAIVEKVDVTDPEALTAFFERAESELGGLDIIHNNAGTICGEPVWPETSLDKIKLVVSVNLLGVMYGTRIAVDALQRRGGGVIINTASTASLGPMPADPMYSGTKTAVVNLVQASAGLAASHNIRVNAILPGMVQTQFIGRTGDGKNPAAWLATALAQTTMLTPDQIAEGIMTLIQDDERAGECLIVDNPPGEGEPPQITRLKDPAEFYRFVADRAKAMAAMFNQGSSD
jgi:NAD(P)-dependent dehydrogenase (short-subunit alcohol dehydrogenase family)